MKEEKIFYVDIPKLPEEQSEAVEWQNVDTFLTREEAVAFVQNHFDPSSKDGEVNLITPSKSITGELGKQYKVADPVTYTRRLSEKDDYIPSKYQSTPEEESWHDISVRFMKSQIYSKHLDGFITFLEQNYLPPKRK